MLWLRSLFSTYVVSKMNKLILQAPINNLGYGVAAYNILKQLYLSGDQVALFPIGKPEFVDECVSSSIMNTQKCQTDIPSVKIWHQNDVHGHVGKGEHIGFPIFELTKFNDLEVVSMNHCDRLFVCSKWAKEIIEQNGIDKEVHVVPLGVDTEIFQPHKSGRKPTIFFNCGKWEKRKGHDIILECFNTAFRSDDNVELWMMCDNPFIGDMNAKWQEIYKNSPMGHKIRIIPRQKTHKDVYNIMKQTDCGLFPARAEGWNLELLEMMACGKAVIASNYSAHTEFCNNENCMLIDIDTMEEAYDGVFFGGGQGEWASFSESSKCHMIYHMRDFHKMKSSGWEQNQAGVETAQKFTWKNSSQELLNGLRI